MLLLTPGPTPVPERIAEAMRRPVVPHRGAEFAGLLARVRPRLSALYQTAGPVLVFAGSGTSAMESALWSLSAPGDHTVSVSAGRFGERWGASLDRLAELFGGARACVHAEWGGAIDEDALAAALTPDTAIVTLVHSETSTGGRADLERLSAIVRARAPRALIVADTVTSLAAMELSMDSWGVDVCVAASQKALMLPPGLGLVALGPRAVERLHATPSCAPASMDLRWRLGAYDRGTVANTPPVTLWFGLEESLAIIEDETIPLRVAAVRRRAQRVRDGLSGLGFTFPAAHPTDSMVAAAYPSGIDDTLRERCRERGVLLAGGQDAWAGSVLRFSCMGAVDDAMVEAGLSAIRESLLSL